MSDMKCHHCGGDLVDASPVEIYCPNPDCWERDMKAARERVRLMWEEQEKQTLRKLKEKYPDVD